MRCLREYPIHRCAVTLPQGGRLRYEDTVFLDTTPFPIGKAKRRRLRRPKRKPIPPRCARQPLPREGARVDTPSFLWKEVPRRGGGWMGIAVSSTQSLPRVGKVASGASRIGFWRYEKDRGQSSQVRRLREHPIHRCAVPLPRVGKVASGASRIGF